LRESQLVALDAVLATIARQLGVQARGHRQVPAGQLIDLEPEALAHDAALEDEREQSVIARD